MGLTHSPLLPTSQLLGVQWAPNVFTVVTAGGDGGGERVLEFQCPRDPLGRC